MVGYPIGQPIDTMLGLAAHKAAVTSRQPPSGCICNIDRGSQYASARYRELPRRSQAGRNDEPTCQTTYDNAKAENSSRPSRSRLNARSARNIRLLKYVQKYRYYFRQ